MDAEMLRCAQDDSQDPAHVLSRDVFSPDVYERTILLDRGDPACYDWNRRSILRIDQLIIKSSFVIYNKGGYDCETE